MSLLPFYGASAPVIVVVAPPAFSIPLPWDAPLAWLVAFLIFLLPATLLAWRSHSILGHWTRYLRQWRQRSWWLVNGGSLLFALGTIILLGALPNWQNAYNRWSAFTALNVTTWVSPVTWIDQSQYALATAIRIGTIVVLLVGGTLLVIGTIRFLREVLVRRSPALATPDWVITQTAPQRAIDQDL